MKFLNKTIFVALLCLVSTVYAKSSSSLAWVDFQKVIAESKMAQDMQNKLQNEFKPKEEAIVKLRTRLQDKKVELQKNQSILQQSQLEKLQNDMVSLNKDLERKTEDFQAEYQTAQAKSSKGFTEKVQSTIEKMGKSEKYDFILQKQVTIYVNPSLDITDKLIKALNR